MTEDPKLGVVMRLREMSTFKLAEESELSKLDVAVAVADEEDDCILTGSGHDDTSEMLKGNTMII